MTARVIDPTPQPEAVKEKTCMNCGVRLEYAEADVQRAPNRDYTGSEDPYHYVACPNCEAHVHTGY